MLAEILKYLFGGIGGSAIVAIIGTAIRAIWKWDQERCKQEREIRITKRTAELEAIERDKKVRYAEAHPKTERNGSEIIIPSSEEIAKFTQTLTGDRHIGIGEDQTIIIIRKSARYLYSDGWRRFFRILWHYLIRPSWKRRSARLMILWSFIEIIIKGMW